MAAPITFGLDISHHQDLSLDLARARRDGCAFVFIKATEGGSYTDAEFAANLSRARAAGLLTAAYVFVRANATPQAHVDLANTVIPRDVPIILDVETAADGTKPTLAQARAVLDAFRAAGRAPVLSYIPLWYWRDVWRQPSLAGWPPLWSSRYPDTVVGALTSEWAQVPTSYWNGYGGLAVAVLQFTSSASIAGHSPLDANAFRGTPDQLAALLGAAANPDGEDDDMANAYSLLVPAGENEHVVLPCPGPGAMAWYVYAAFGRKVQLHQCAFVMETPKGSPNAEFVPGAGWGWDLAKDETWIVDPDRPGHFDIPHHPDGRQPVGISLRYTADHPFTLARG